ncbi:Hypothetical_protein [Hexamita inflata]|uniref:Hypothetical_protein n=1 Tax=Hexamita inflata TaxID=28002 RepID=A0AA86RJH9_9EUKA|nr:Hypothetical protein HINF_LOCUS63221 [Hexamita inflata]
MIDGDFNNEMVSFKDDSHDNYKQECSRSQSPVSDIKQQNQNNNFNDNQTNTSKTTQELVNQLKEQSIDYSILYDSNGQSSDFWRENCNQCSTINSSSVSYTETDTTLKWSYVELYHLLRGKQHIANSKVIAKYLQRSIISCMCKSNDIDYIIDNRLAFQSKWTIKDVRKILYWVIKVARSEIVDQTAANFVHKSVKQVTAMLNELDIKYTDINGTKHIFKNKQ